MSRYETIKTISAEIERLNHEIDLKIILGRPYMVESKRHKTLLARLKRLTPWYAFLI